MENKSFFQKLFGKSAAKANPSNITDGGYIALNKYDTEYVLSQNSVIVKQTRFGFLNTNILFKSPSEKARESIMFSFRDAGRVIDGFYEYITTEVEDFDQDKLIKIIIDDYHEKDLFRTTYKTHVDGRQAFIITSQSDIGDHFTLVVVEGSNLTIFEVYSEKNYLFSNPDFAYKAFSTYKFIGNKNTKKRVIKDFICFETNDDRWSYVFDHDEHIGYIITFNSEKGFDYWVFVDESEYGNINEMKSGILHTLDKLFSKKFTFRDVSITCKGIETTKDIAFFLVEYKMKKFEISIMIYKENTEDSISCADMIKLGLIDELIKEMKTCFYFNY